jgi:anti-sigma factor RsiW
MKCEDYRILIEDHVDGSLDDRAAARVSSHTASCAKCASFHLELIREQEVYARYKRDVELTPILWTSIAERIKQDRAEKPQGLMARLREQLRGAFAAPRLSPALAAVLVIIAIGATVFVMSRLNPRERDLSAANNSNKAGEISPGLSGAPSPAPDNQPGRKDLASNEATEHTAPPKHKPTAPSLKQPQRAAAQLTPAQLVREAEYKYLTAIAMLSRDVNRKRSQLDPMMLARFDASLAEIDRTIKETRQVVRSNPEDPIALQYLLAAYSKKVDVLREMTND